MPGPPVIASTTIRGWAHHLLGRFEVGSATVTTRLRMPQRRKAISSIRLISFRDLFAPDGAKVNAVARRQHADAVVDDGFRRVGAWGD